MSTKAKRILAIIALGFMAVFTVSFVAFLIDPKMLNGVIAFVALFSGVFGIGLFFVIKGLSAEKTFNGADERADGDADAADPKDGADAGANDETKEETNATKDKTNSDYPKNSS
ncbi:MAG: hypothetical protein LBP26_07170 [Clostridiales bacterium]|jgi:hypothetical protein|nr:hypothetical protein [Clostridiales bacterium]